MRPPAVPAWRVFLLERVCSEAQVYCRCVSARATFDPFVVERTGRGVFGRVGNSVQPVVRDDPPPTRAARKTEWLQEFGEVDTIVTIEVIRDAGDLHVAASLVERRGLEGERVEEGADGTETAPLGLDPIHDAGAQS